MALFKGTPGPWLVNHLDHSEHAHITSEARIEESMMDIAIVEYGHPDAGIDEGPGKEQQANAQLIATAPCLLKALQDLVNSLDSDKLNGNDAGFYLSEAKEILRKALY
ncbi:hypothetical protein [Xenorhabdus bovienii]|uniref:hypothetical protein n=1 Tax=Xenorhabdus bovienii TaxID=40576 RepID=UPI0004D8688A|nr:hypothetical protein [Xenorhabdus bovienii]CDG88127.1 conserved hypothetical protein [Xenorhabdus bovienii str. feltiae France]CDG91800.1 conserved hypothetical protein [Xenorhabdus bovienii str. feltiae Florida]